jgi:hypothetical protein
MKKVILLCLVIPFSIGSIGSSTAQYEPVEIDVQKHPNIPGVPGRYQWLFQACEGETGFPAEIVGKLVGNAENWSWNPKAKGPKRKDGHRDLGLFQHNSKYVPEFAYRYNDGKPYDPMDPKQAAIITFRILADNYRQLDGDMTMTIASYRQGVSGVKKNGPTMWYVNRILGEQ